MVPETAKETAKRWDQGTAIPPAEATSLVSETVKETARRWDQGSAIPPAEATSLVSKTMKETARRWDQVTRSLRYLPPRRRLWSLRQ